jgi:hypothetical protein
MQIQCSLSIQVPYYCKTISKDMHWHRQYKKPVVY